jgi:hypothetical protein
MARGKHTVRWRSLGAAVTFLVAAVAGVVGGRITGRLTPALVVFAALAVTGMLITYLLDRGTSAHGPAEAGTRDSAASQAGHVDVRGAQGVQIGNQNRQENYFGPDRDR